MEINRGLFADMIRRQFLKLAAAGLSLPVGMWARVNGCSPKRQEQHMEIKKNGSVPSTKAPAEYFTGLVRIDPLSSAHDPSRTVVASVTFEPGARTAWHTHPLGQILVVTAGVGHVQSWGGPVEEIRPGDVVWFSPGEKHWHGPGAATAMTHIAIQEQLDGKTGDWMVKVTDEQYQAK
jgi:quercetin dioxygenase-like cupin family protein